MNIRMNIRKTEHNAAVALPGSKHIKVLRWLMALLSITVGWSQLSMAQGPELQDIIDRESRLQERLEQERLERERLSQQPDVRLQPVPGKTDEGFVFDVLSLFR